MRRKAGRSAREIKIVGDTNSGGFSLPAIRYRYQEQLLTLALLAENLSDRPVNGLEAALAPGVLICPDEISTTPCHSVV